VVKAEDSDDMFLAIDKMAESLKKTCFLEEMIKKIKANIR
jgi:ribosome-associated translation inhibitor RaiA